MICYDCNCNAILAEPIKNRSASELLQVYKLFYSKLYNAGLAPQMHKLDDEMSAEVEGIIATQDATIQYVQPDNHQKNAAQGGIQT